MNARRATNRTPNPRVRVIALLALSFLLALLDGRGSTGFLNTIRSGASAVLSPLQSGANAMSRPAVDFLRDWSEVGSKDDRIKELNSVNAKLRQQLLTVQDLDRQAKELHHLFQMAGTAGYNIVPA
ncbi:MAG: hypothetical protein RL410_1291, partial [Actinomycetota bacterium]